MRHRRTSAAAQPAIPDDNAPVPPARRPTRWTVRRVRSIAFVLLGLAVAASLVSVYLTYRAAEESAAQAEAVDRRLAVLEDDLAERTRQRDAERDAAAARAAEDRELFRARFCEVLAELAATFPNLDELRAALACAAPAAPAAGSLPSGPPAAAQGPSPPATLDPVAPQRPGAPPAPPAPPPASSPPPSPPPADPGPICSVLPLLC